MSAPFLPALDAPGIVREVAFGLLLRDRRPIDLSDLAMAAGMASEPVRATVTSLAQGGWLDLDEAGRVAGSAGLSLSTGPHVLTLGGAEFRTWCAYDALGIAAALEADALVETTCGRCGKAISLAFRNGEPARSGPERLWLAEGGDDLRGSFCTPTVLLCGEEHGADWAETQGGRGRLLDLADGARLGGAAWAGLCRDRPATDAAMTHEVELIWFEDCANHPAARSMLEDVIAEVAPGTVIHDVDATDPAVADRVRFPGSPTIRVDGVDVDPTYVDPGDYTPRCRLYRTSAGLRGLPERQWIETALRSTGSRSGPVGAGAEGDDTSADAVNGGHGDTIIGALALSVAACCAGPVVGLAAGPIVVATAAAASLVTAIGRRRLHGGGSRQILAIAPSDP